MKEMCVSLTSQSSPHFFFLRSNQQGAAPAFCDVTQPLSAAGLQRTSREERRMEREETVERGERGRMQNTRIALKNTHTSSLPFPDEEEDTGSDEAGRWSRSASQAVRPLRPVNLMALNKRGRLIGVIRNLWCSLKTEILTDL